MLPPRRPGSLRPFARTVEPDQSAPPPPVGEGRHPRRQGRMMTFVHDEDALSRAEQRASPLYTGRVEVYAKAVKGQLRTLKWAGLAVLLAIYYVTPWLRWDRGPDLPRQAVLADMASARAYFFGIEIWPQEVYYLTGILMLAAFGLWRSPARSATSRGLVVRPWPRTAIGDGAMSGGTHLGLEERERLAAVRAEGLSLRSSARALARAASTVSRELRRNALPRGGYLPVH